MDLPEPSEARALYEARSRTHLRRQLPHALAIGVLTAIYFLVLWLTGVPNWAWYLPPFAVVLVHAILFRRRCSAELKELRDLCRALTAEERKQIHRSQFNLEVMPRWLKGVCLALIILGVLGFVTLLLVASYWL